MRRLGLSLLVGWLALPALAQPGGRIPARFLTSPVGVGIYQEVSSAGRPGRYLGRSDRPVLLDARGSQVRLNFRAAGFRDFHLTVAPGYFYAHRQWPEQGVIELTPIGWWSWLRFRALGWLGLGSLLLALAGCLSGYRRGRAAPAPVGGYRMLELLGEGGCSRVYRAVPDQAGPGAHEGAVAFKIYREAGWAASNPSGHPGIVETYHCGQDQGVAYAVMELVPGGTLRARLGPQGAPVSEVRNWLGQLLDGLNFAHAQGFVHADLKPENILLSDSGRLKLTDFAGSRRALGTQAYLAPEQLLAQAVGPWTDQYGLALLAYEMLTGSLPAGGVTRSLQPLPPVRRAGEEIHPDLDPVLQKMLQVEPQHRFPTLHEAGVALLEALK